MDSPQWPSDKVRETFVNYFTSKCNHTNVLSSPTVPYDDPTLLFANSGMTQFKPIFLGTVDPKSPQAQWKRAANSQKCIRAGGKHNDLDDVGKDTYHHTFFEMLGNWSFADYFQQEAIDWAWDLLVNVFGLEPRRIYVTYFKGDDVDQLPADLEAKKLWGKYLPDSHILPFGKKENFWEMGDVGPCGPCSEIHYDRRSDREDAASWVNMDSPEVIEIWNLVFMAYNREQSRKLTPLPHKHVDTGMGFERLTSILQDKSSNYDTDVFQPLFDKIAEITGSPPYTGLVGDEDAKEGPHRGKDTAYRIVADHIRTLVFALTDGAVPSSEGRGYVLRRILRRAVRAGRHYLNAKDGFFHQLVDTVVNKFGGAFPELRTKVVEVKKIIQKEEEHFQSTLNRGEAKFKRMTKTKVPGDVLNAADTFLLYGTFGFPLDLIQIMAEDLKLHVDLDGFAKLKQTQSELTAAAYGQKRTGVPFDLKAAALDQLKKLGVLPTDDSHKYKPDPLLEGSVVKSIWKGNPEHGSFVQQVTVGEECGIVLDKTNFYSESGGQLFDCGFLQLEDASFMVQEVKVFGGYVAHIGSLVEGTIKVGDSVVCSFSNERRLPIMANHTATHMTNLALRKILKVPADQRGSIVSDEKFRFDFTAPEALTHTEVQKIEEFVNELIKQDLPVFIQEVPLQDALKIFSIRALFSEAYPDPVRVVSVGMDINTVLADRANQKWLDFSLEFCGGTHLTQTSQAEDFVIISEEAVCIGERRIVAVTGSLARKAREDAANLERMMQELKPKTGEDLKTSFQAFMNTLNTSRIPVTKKLELRKEISTVEDKIKKEFNESLLLKKGEGANFIETTVNDLQTNQAQFVIAVLPNSNNKLMSDTAGELTKVVKEKLNRDIAVLFFTQDLKKKNVIMIATVPASLIAKGLKANEWVSGVASVLGGKGGGSPKGDVAQGFCNAFDNLDGAVQEATNLANAKLN